MCDRRWNIQLKLGLEIDRPVYKVIHSSTTHLIKLVHLNGRKDFSMRPTEGKRTLHFFYLCLVSALCVCPLWHGRYQANDVFLAMPALACHHRFLSWQQWFIFIAQALFESWYKESLTYPHKKKLHRIRSGSLVASEAVPGLWQLCVWSSTGTNADWGSCSHQRK